MKKSGLGCGCLFSFLAPVLSIIGIFVLSNLATAENPEIAAIGAKIDRAMGQGMKTVTGGYMGDQPAYKGGGDFTPDGKYLVYVSAVQNVTRVVKAGSMPTKRFGRFRLSLRMIEVASGRQLLDENEIFLGQMTANVVAVDNTHAWVIATRNSSSCELLLFDLKKRQLVFQGADFKRLNPKIPMLPDNCQPSPSFFEPPPKKKGIVLEGTDGQRYWVSQKTGKASLTKTQTRAIRLAQPTHASQTENSVKGLSTTNGSRQQIKARDEGPATVQSTMDFIAPRFFVAPATAEESSFDRLPLRYKDHIFVVGSMSTANSLQKELAMLDAKTLKQVWKRRLPTQEATTWVMNYDQEFAQLRGSKMHLVNHNWLVEISTKTGKITRKTHL